MLFELDMKEGFLIVGGDTNGVGSKANKNGTHVSDIRRANVETVVQTRRQGVLMATAIADDADGCGRRVLFRWMMGEILTGHARRPDY